MKKVLLFLSFIFLLLSCSNSSILTTEDLFVGNQKEFVGGFENSGYTISSKVVDFEGSRFLIEDTSDTATHVQRVYLLKNNEIILVFTGEDQIADLSKLDINSGEVVVKSPFELGKKWESNGNLYEITALESDKVQVTKSFPSGVKEIITYKKGEGKIDRKTIF